MDNSSAVNIISFLGTTQYTPCCYVHQDNCECTELNSTPFKYVQTAICCYWRDIMKRPIHAYLFCTADAKNNNWYNASMDGIPGKLFQIDEDFKPLKLRNELENNGFKDGVDFTEIDIKDPFSEAGVWEIFKAVDAAILDNAEIVFDITHSFRSLPMVMSILLNYLKVTKHVKLCDCCYGAFEELLKTMDNGGKERPAEYAKRVKLLDRKAPLVSIKSIFELNEWTQAVHDFEELGNGKRLTDLAKGLTRRLRKEEVSGAGNKDRLKQLTDIEKVAQAIGDFSSDVMRNRLCQAQQKDGIQNLPYQDILTVKWPDDQKDGFMNALIPLIQKITCDLTSPDKLGLVNPSTEESGAMNGIKAAYWAYEHEMIPQAITLLKEAIISFFCAKYQQKLCQGIWDGTTPMTAQIRKDIREKMEEVINSKIKPKKDGFRFKMCDEITACDLCQDIELQDGKSFWVLLDQITKGRNYIDHAGTGTDSFPKNILTAEFWSQLSDMKDFADLKGCLCKQP